MRGGRSRPARRSFMPRRRQRHRRRPRQDAEFRCHAGRGAPADRIRGASRRQNATPLEARAGHAAYDAASGRVTLTCTTQMPHLMRTAIADVLGMPESDLRVIAPDVGGGFGQKMSLTPEYVVLVWLARATAKLGRLDRGPAGKPDGRLSQPRPGHRARRRLRPGRQAHGAVGAISSPMSAPIRAFRPPAGSSR